MNRRTVAACVLAAALVAMSPSGAFAWAPASTATVHPGVQTFTAGAQCTANFIYSDGTDTYIGQAAHCSGTGAATETDGCARAVAARRHAGRGHRRLAARDAWSTTRGSRCRRAARPIPTPAPTTTSRSIKLDPADVAVTNPSVPGFGGPTGHGEPRRHRLDGLHVRQLVAARRRHEAEPEAGHRRPEGRRRLEHGALHADARHPRRLGLGLPDRDRPGRRRAEHRRARAARRLQRRRRPAARARLHARPRRPAGERRERHAAVQRQPARRHRRRASPPARHGGGPVARVRRHAVAELSASSRSPATGSGRRSSRRRSSCCCGCARSSSSRSTSSAARRSTRTARR